MTLPVVDRLDELAALVEKGDDFYVRWSKGPEADLTQPPEQTSRDALTGVTLPGLSANPLAVEPWWGDRPVRLWVARRLYDYRHLRDLRGPGVRPWVLRGEEIGRGPDNEPLVRCHEPIAWITEDALAEAEALIDAQQSPEWGPLDRRES